MADQIFTRAAMQARDAAAFARGTAITGHGMNHDAAALPDWEAGWLSARYVDGRQNTPASIQNIDSRQAGA